MRPIVGIAADGSFIRAEPAAPPPAPAKPAVPTFSKADWLEKTSRATSDERQWMLKYAANGKVKIVD